MDDDDHLLERKEEFHVLTSEENKIFSVMPRFTIMLILLHDKNVKIKDLSFTLNLTPGNLDHHIRTLEEKGFLIKKAQIFSKKIYNAVEITKLGKDSFTKYLLSLKKIID